ncbi:MAG TPA: GNAT family N-acetyltransferase [Actinomycetota bacterium]|nr:GNAT family N-acetyltransferase [Actinomycetota bacterium]
MEIREVRPEEYEEAGDVVAGAYSEFWDPNDSSWGEHIELVRDVAGRVDRTVVLVAVEDGRVLGSASIEMDDVIGDDDREAIPGVAGLRMVGVDPTRRRHGIGRALIEEVIARCCAAGKHTLILRTTPPMVPAQRLYQSLGFERAADLDIPIDEHLTLLGYRLRL